jgi:predicted dehydrogenase
MKAAIIGAGFVAREHLACLKKLPGVQTVAVCDLSPAMAEATAEQFGVARWYADHCLMIQEQKPDVVHITTPPQSHMALTMDALENGCHAFVEKPLALTLGDVLKLRDIAHEHSRLLIEDNNYLFNSPVQTILGYVKSGALGEVVHVDVMFSVNIRYKGSRYIDANLPHPTLKLPGGAIADFLTHLAYLAHAFIGPARAVRTIWNKRDSATILPSDEFRALIDGEKATALVGFSSHAQPNAFMLRVHGTKMRCTASLWEGLLAIEKLRAGPGPFVVLGNGLAMGGAYCKNACAGLCRKLAGSSVIYEGLCILLERTYKAISSKNAPPLTLEQIEDVTCLVHELTREDLKL